MLGFLLGFLGSLLLHLGERLLDEKRALDRLDCQICQDLQLSLKLLLIVQVYRGVRMQQLERRFRSWNIRDSRVRRFLLDYVQWLLRFHFLKSDC